VLVCSHQNWDEPRASRAAVAAAAAAAMIRRLINLICPSFWWGHRLETVSRAHTPAPLPDETRTRARLHHRDKDQTRAARLIWRPGPPGKGWPGLCSPARLLANLSLARLHCLAHGARQQVHALTLVRERARAGLAGLVIFHLASLQVS